MLKNEIKTILKNNDKNQKKYQRERDEKTLKIKESYNIRKKSKFLK